MSNTNDNYRKLTTALLAIWFLLAFGASALHVFASSTSFSAPVPFGLAALLPLIAFLIWYSASSGFREFLLSLNPRTLTFVQSWRVAGYVFLVLQAYNLLPASFALPAGWGDIAIGVTAPLAATYLATNVRRRTSFALWNVLGMLDLVMAVTLGVLSSNSTFGILAPGSVTTRIMSELPLSLLPSFAVPLLFIFHIIAIAGARRAAVMSSEPAMRLAAGH